MIEGLGMDEN